jgi:hypothetical protein
VLVTKMVAFLDVGTFLPPDFATPEGGATKTLAVKVVGGGGATVGLLDAKDVTAVTV